MLIPVALSAQTGGDIPSKIAALEAATKSAQSAGDNAWMLVSAALVLMMTGPGLALFYGGLVRRKNVLGTMMHSFILMAVVTVIWAVVGYSLAFGGSSPFIGDLRFAFLNDVGSAPNADYAATIPQQTFMVYQLMFAIITPALISGAFAERMKFSAMLLFTVLWTPDRLLPHGAHGVGQGRPAQRVRWAARFPASISPAARWCTSPRGVSALVCALYLGKRIGFPSAAIEAAQPGDQLHRRLPAVGGLVRLQRRQRAGRHRAWPPAPSWPPTSAPPPPRSAGWWRSGCDNGKPSVLGGISGCVAGLVAITPASGFVKPFPALLIGFCAGVVCYLMVTARQAQVRLRRCAGCFRRARRRRNAGRHPHRRLRHQRGQRRFEGRRRQSTCRSAWWTATAGRCSTR